MVILIISIAFFMNCLAFIPHAAVHGLGRADLKAKLNLILLPVYALLCPLLIHTSKLEGAALAKLILSSIDSIVLFCMVKRITGSSITSLFDVGLRKSIFISLVVALPAIAFSHFCHGIPCRISVLGMAVAVFLYLFVAKSMDDKDRTFIREKVLKRFGWNRTSP